MSPGQRTRTAWRYLDASRTYGSAACKGESQVGHQFRANQFGSYPKLAGLRGLVLGLIKKVRRLGDGYRSYAVHPNPKLAAVKALGIPSSKKLGEQAPGVLDPRATTGYHRLC